MTTSGRLILGSLVVGLALTARAAFADTHDPVTADALFREARELIKSKDYPAACPKLAESYRLEPAPGTLYNLAECEEKEGKIASSLQRWQSLVDLLTTSKKLTDPRLPAARKHVEALTKRVPRLELQLRSSVPEGTIVLRDGVELRAASFGLQLPVEPGEHKVLVRAAYRRDNVVSFSLQEGESKRIELDAGEPDGTEPRPVASAPTPAPTPAPPPPPAVTSSPPPPPEVPPPVATAPGNRRTLGLVLGSVGAAALVGAGVTSVVLRGYRTKVEAHCDLGARQCDDEGYDAARSGTTLAPINLALWLVGAAGAGAGTYLYLTAPQAAQTSRGGQPAMLWVKGEF